MADKEVSLGKSSSLLDNEIATITATMTTKIIVTKNEIAIYFLVFDIVLVLITTDSIHLVNDLMHDFHSLSLLFHLSIYRFHVPVVFYAFSQLKINISVNYLQFQHVSIKEHQK